MESDNFLLQKSECAHASVLGFCVGFSIFFVRFNIFKVTWKIFITFYCLVYARLHYCVFAILILACCECFARPILITLHYINHSESAVAASAPAPASIPAKNNHGWYWSMLRISISPSLKTKMELLNRSHLDDAVNVFHFVVHAQHMY